MSGKEFYRKKITQTEYRGSTYTARHDKDSQFLDVDLQPVSLNPKYYDGFKDHLHNQLTRFLSKVVADDYLPKILTTVLLKNLYKLLGIK